MAARLRGSAAGAPVRREPETGPAKGPGAWRAVAAVLALAAVAGVAWAAWGWIGRPLERQPATTELSALQSRLVRIRAEMRPLAESFGSESGTATPIDVDAYRDRVDRIQSVVSGVNDVPVASPEGLEVRDTILTGGSEVVDGLALALDALASDDQTRAAEAQALVEEGMSMLDAAAARLEELLGDRQST